MSFMGNLMENLRKKNRKSVDRFRKIKKFYVDGCSDEKIVKPC